MIDWLTISLPYNGQPIGAQYFKADFAGGVVEPAFTRAHHLKGSFDSGLSVEAIGNRITISGNPVKHLTGQNVIGTDDIRALCDLVVPYVFNKLGIKIPLLTVAALRAYDIVIHRVDCTHAQFVGSTEDVRAFLRAFSELAHARYRGRGFFDDGMCSVMFGLRISPGQKPKGSSYSALKLYCKETEIKKRPLRCPEKYHAALMKYAVGHIRVEALYRRKELRQMKLDMVKNWDKTTCNNLNQRWLEKIEMAPNIQLTPQQELELPMKLRSSYLHWSNGVDLRSYVSRATFWRHRKELLEYGIDISAEPPKARETNIIPMMEVLTARPACHDTENLFWELVQAA